MDRSFLRQHRLCRTNKWDIIPIVINMSNVSSSSSTVAGVTVGTEVCTAQISSNVVTLTYLEPLMNTPYFDFSVQSPANAAIDVTSATTTSLVFQTVTRDAHGTPITNAIVFFELWVPAGLSTI